MESRTNPIGNTVALCSLSTLFVLVGRHFGIDNVVAGLGTATITLSNPIDNGCMVVLATVRGATAGCVIVEAVDDATLIARPLTADGEAGALGFNLAVFRYSTNVGERP